jgi:rsbT antagonist protein RsbS
MIVCVPNARTLCAASVAVPATTVIVGIQPDVALAMVELGLGTGAVQTALDLEEGLAYLDVMVSSVKRPSR